MNWTAPVWVFCLEEGDSEAVPFPRSGGGAGDHGDGLGELQATAMEALSVRRREGRERDGGGSGKKGGAS